MSRLRLALELLGSALWLAVHFPIALVYALGSSLQGVAAVPYWAAVGGGYLAMLGLALFRPGDLGRVPRRGALDRWLLTFPPAVALSATLVSLEWPLAFASWDAHGFGAAGGEANALFLPWLHSVLWLLSANTRRPTAPAGGNAWRS